MFIFCVIDHQVASGLCCQHLSRTKNIYLNVDKAFPMVVLFPVVNRWGNHMVDGEEALLRCCVVTCVRVEQGGTTGVLD